MEEEEQGRCSQTLIQDGPGAQGAPIYSKYPEAPIECSDLDAVDVKVTWASGFSAGGTTVIVL